MPFIPPKNPKTEAQYTISLFILSALIPKPKHNTISPFILSGEHREPVEGYPPNCWADLFQSSNPEKDA